MSRRREKVTLLIEEAYYIQKALMKYYTRDETVRKALRLLALKMGDIKRVKVKSLLSKDP